MAFIKKWVCRYGYIIKVSSRFKKDFKRCIKRGLDMSLITQAMNTLAETGTLPSQYRPYKLSGNMDGIWECHIQSDWLILNILTRTKVVAHAA